MSDIHSNPRTTFAHAAILAATLIPAPSLAFAETWIVGSIGSYHLERGKRYCEFNPGIGIEHDIVDKWRAVIGQYNNSFCLPSAYLGVRYAPLSYGNFKLGTAFILVSGYDDGIKKKDEQQDILFAPLGVLSYEVGKYGLNLVMVPPHGGFRGAIGIQAKVRF